MSTRIILGVAGAVVGYVATGGTPQGAYLGFTIGYGVGGFIEGPPRPPDVEGPRLSDLKIQTASYGLAIPIVYGTTRISGNVLWKTDLVEHQHRTESDGGGKGGGDDGGGGQITYTYSVGFAVGLCEGPVAGIGRIWADGKLILDQRATVTSLNNVTASTGLFTVTIYNGTETQMPDALMEAHLGAGHVPAYRGRCYCVFSDFDVTDYGKRIPQLSFEVIGAINQELVTTTRYFDLAYTPFEEGDTAYTRWLLYNPMLREIWVTDFPLVTDPTDPGFGNYRGSIGRVDANDGSNKGSFYPDTDYGDWVGIPHYDSSINKVWLQDAQGAAPYDEGSLIKIDPVWGDYVRGTELYGVDGEATAERGYDEPQFNPYTGEMWIGESNDSHTFYRLDKATGLPTHVYNVPFNADPLLWPIYAILHFASDGRVWMTARGEYGDGYIWSVADGTQTEGTVTYSGWYLGTSNNPLSIASTLPTGYLHGTNNYSFTSFSVRSRAAYDSARDSLWLQLFHTSPEYYSHTIAAYTTWDTFGNSTYHPAVTTTTGTLGLAFEWTQSVIARWNTQSGVYTLHGIYHRIPSLAWDMTITNALAITTPSPHGFSYGMVVVCYGLPWYQGQLSDRMPVKVVRIISATQFSVLAPSAYAWGNPASLNESSGLAYEGTAIVAPVSMVGFELFRYDAFRDVFWAFPKYMTDSGVTVNSTALLEISAAASNPGAPANWWYTSQNLTLNALYVVASYAETVSTDNYNPMIITSRVVYVTVQTDPNDGASADRILVIVPDLRSVGPLNLGAIVSDLSVRAGLTTDQIDVTELIDDVRGYTISNNMSVRDAISPLMEAYFFDAVESDGIVHFPKRDGSSVATIPLDDLVPAESDK